MVAKKKKKEDDAVFTKEAAEALMRLGHIELCIIGRGPFQQGEDGRPMLMHAKGPRACLELLIPSPKKNRAERSMHLKHKIYDEFQECLYTTHLPAPTRLVFPAKAFKKAIASAALDAAGLGKAKTEIGRLVQVGEETVPIWGRPFMRMDSVNLPTIGKPPDMRTRCMVLDWATVVSFDFMASLVSDTIVYTLLRFAGVVRGIGDGRPELGSDNFGQFEVVNPDNPEFLRRQKFGRKIQDEMIANPQPAPWDTFTLDLKTKYDAEVLRRQSLASQPEQTVGRVKRKKGEPVPAEQLNGGEETHA